QGPAAGQAADAPGRDLPPALASLEFLIGRWKGQGVPKDDPARRFRGWTETHTWAWLFARGKPVGLTGTIQGGKVLERATLTFDGQTNRYRLVGRGPGAAWKSLAYLGSLDSSGKLLALTREVSEGQERLTLRANSNYVRYTLTLDHKEPG